MSDKWIMNYGSTRVGQFVLENEPPKPKPKRPENDDSRQRVLFSGMDCLPGQMDLFDDPAAAD